MKLLETEFGTRFKTWIDQNKPSSTSTYEFKVSNGNTYNLKEWREGRQAHQEGYLINSTNKMGVYHKISDASSELKPFDAFYICNANAYLVIWFNKYQQFFIIHVDELPKNTVSLKYKDLKNPHILILKKKIVHNTF